MADKKALTDLARETVDDFVTALLESIAENGGGPRDLGMLYDDLPDVGDEDPGWPVHDDPSTHYFLGYLHCAADVLGCDRRSLIRNRTKAIGEKGARNASQPKDVESDAGAAEAGH